MDGSDDEEHEVRLAEGQRRRSKGKGQRAKADGAGAKGQTDRGIEAEKRRGE